MICVGVRVQGLGFQGLGCVRPSRQVLLSSGTLLGIKKGVRGP